MDEEESSSEPSWERLARINRFYFKKNPKLKFSNVEMINSNGGSLTFDENNDLGEVVRKMTIRYASTQRGLDLLENEMLCLEHVRGAEHVIQTIASVQSKVNVSGTGRDREYPILALEYLPHGSLLQFRERVTKANRFIPNRVLWRVFLCLARQQLAFLLPQRASHDLPLWRETIGSKHGHSTLGVIEQGSLGDGRNHRFRDHEPGDEDHGLVPAVVSTNFTRGRLSREFADTVYLNMYSIGRFMTSLALNMMPEEDIKFESRPHIMPALQIRRIFPEQKISMLEITTDVPTILMDDPGIDYELKELIARCLAREERDMPTPRNLLLLCEDGVRFRSPTDIDTIPVERQEELRRGGDGDFVRQFILNADVNAGRSILGEQNRFGEWG
ncbi:hypothetical protein F4781DRAFT_412138 [Annulohypoxylon bovei var. microspora]|nr:hypothetical protein F4781DRAFT_412138 [Annulohypoxylon bovei var. microspora]